MTVDGPRQGTELGSSSAAEIDVDLDDLRSFLLTRGWAMVEEANRLQAWQHPDGEELLLPLQTSQRRPSDLVAEAVRRVGYVASAPTSQIRESVRRADSDFVRFRLGVGQGDDSLPLQSGVEAIEAVEKILGAAARASFGERQRVYRNSNSGHAKTYLAAARLAQSRSGSYVLSIATPVVPTDEESSLFERTEDTKPRVVHRTLLGALTSVAGAIIEYRASQNAEVFDNAVEHGVSAELCRGLTALIDAGGDVEIYIEPSPHRYDESLLPRQQFAHADIGILEAAVRHLDSVAEVDAVIVGFVERLYRPAPGGPGLVSIRQSSGAGMVRVRLSPDDYEVAINAHHDSYEVTISGSLAREGNLYWLYAATGLRRHQPTAEPGSTVVRLV